MTELNDFKIYLLNHDRKKITIDKHLYVMGRIFRVCPNLAISEIESFLAERKEAGNKNTSINAFLETLRCYAGYIGRQDILDYFKYRKPEAYERAVMSDAEIAAFLALKCPNRNYKRSWFMYTVFFHIMFFTGMRPREVTHLNVNDIDFGLKVIHIREGKTPLSVGQVPLPENVIPVLQKYLSTLRGDKLFPSAKGGTSQDGYLMVGCPATHFQKRIKLLGIVRNNLSPYSARHSYGTRLGEEDVNLYTIKNLMRHSKITTTETYLHMNLKTMRNGQNKHPLIKLSASPLNVLLAYKEETDKFNFLTDTRVSSKFKDNLYRIIHDEIKRLSRSK